MIKEIAQTPAFLYGGFYLKIAISLIILFWLLSEHLKSYFAYLSAKRVQKLSVSLNGGFTHEGFEFRT